MFFRLADSQTSLDSLPSEVLVRIFDYVYQEQLSKPRGEIRLSELRTHSLFPYSLLHLCEPIRQIVLRVPRFMTLIVVFVDEFNPKSVLLELFKASGSLLVDAFFISKHIKNPPTIDREGEEIVKIVKIFEEVGCLHRCRHLLFHVRRSASLPSANYLSGNYPNFQTLHFFSRYPTKIPQLTKFWYGRPKTKEQGALGALRHLTLAGTIFAQYVTLPGWPESFMPIYQKQFTIYNLSDADIPGQAYDLYNLIETLSQMSHFSSLTLFNVDLDFASCRNKPKLELWVENLHLQGFSSEKLSAFWRCISNRIAFRSITLEKCGLITDGRFRSHGMVLQDITTDSATLLETLESWDGVTLDLIRCTGVDDSLIKRMCRLTDNATFHLQKLRNITISQCRSSPDPNVVQTFISPHLLKRLVKKRIEAAEKHEPTMDLYHILPMWSIYLRGDGPQLSEEDKKWFFERVERFGWYSQARGEPDLADDLAQWDWDGIVLPGDGDDQGMIGSSQPSSQPEPDPMSQGATTTTSHPIAIIPNQSELQEPAVIFEEYDNRGPQSSANSLRNFPSYSSLDEIPSSQTTVPNSRSSSPYLEDDYSMADWSISDLQLMDAFPSRS